MKAYHCEGCGSLVFFDNIFCVKCGHALGFLPEYGKLTAIEPAQNGTWKALLSEGKEHFYRKCDNSQQQVCNWLVAIDDPNPFCVSCRLNQTIPNMEIPGNHDRWLRLEMAKRRLVYTILQLGLPLEGVPQEKRPSLRFNFLGDAASGPPVATGHQDGLITINIAEADDAERERRRVSLHEPFRTLLGHFRHEVGHYYWDRLIANSEWLNRWRSLFGDENRDYEQSLKAYYQAGPANNWQSNYVSAYASAHPWEDWAETWAHYFHLVDTLETAASFGLTLQPEHPMAAMMTADLRKVEGTAPSFDVMVEQWYPLTYALNSLNRGMGLQDLYPFILSTSAVEKLRFIHEVCASGH